MDFFVNWIIQNTIDHVVLADGFDHFSCFRAMGNSHSGIKHAQVVVNFGHRADSAAWISCMGFLFDGDSGGKPFYLADFRLGHLFDKLAGIRGKRFDIAPLSFRIDGVKCQRTFPDPDGPVQMVNFSRGIVTSTCLRLFCSAPST